MIEKNQSAKENFHTVDKIVELTKKYFKVDELKLAECGGAHHYCLNCHRCRRPFVFEQLYDGSGNISSYIDHTNLKPDATEASIKQLCKEAKKYNFKAV
jgi:deoxyribose-phosphate aldolase